MPDTGDPAGHVERTRTSNTRLNPGALTNAGQRQLQQTLGGQYMPGQNQMMDRAIEAQVRRLAPQVNAQFGASGQSLGSPLAQDAIARTIADTSALQFGNERNRQMQATNMVPTFAGQTTQQTSRDPYFENDFASILGAGLGLDSLLGGRIGDAAGGLFDSVFGGDGAAGTAAAAAGPAATLANGALSQSPAGGYTSLGRLAGGGFLPTAAGGGGLAASLNPFSTFDTIQRNVPGMFEPSQGMFDGTGRGLLDPSQAGTAADPFGFNFDSVSSGLGDIFGGATSLAAPAASASFDAISAGLPSMFGGGGSSIFPIGSEFGFDAVQAGLPEIFQSGMGAGDAVGGGFFDSLGSLFGGGGEGAGGILGGLAGPAAIGAFAAAMPHLTEAALGPRESYDRNLQTGVIKRGQVVEGGGPEMERFAGALQGMRGTYNVKQSDIAGEGFGIETLGGTKIPVMLYSGLSAQSDAQKKQEAGFGEFSGAQFMGMEGSEAAGFIIRNIMADPGAPAAIRAVSKRKAKNDADGKRMVLAGDVAAELGILGKVAPTSSARQLLGLSDDEGE